MNDNRLPDLFFRLIYKRIKNPKHFCYNSRCFKIRNLAYSGRNKDVGVLGGEGQWRGVLGVNKNVSRLKQRE